MYISICHTGVSQITTKFEKLHILIRKNCYMYEPFHKCFLQAIWILKEVYLYPGGSKSFLRLSLNILGISLDKTQELNVKLSWKEKQT